MIASSIVTGELVLASAMTSPIEWIDTDAALTEFCSHAAGEPYITFDTEFHRERTYYAQLALVQIGTQTRTACIDPLAKMSLAPLYELLFNESLLKVVHAGRQDLEIFFDHQKKVIAPLFDTQVAAALLGYGDQIGYGALVKAVCSVDLAKTFARTDWKRRPLDKDVIAYAAGDVTYLRQVYEHLASKLKKVERAAWVDEEQAFLLDEKTYAPDPQTLWQSVKGASRLKGVDVAVLQDLAAYRDRNARRADLPKKRVLSDDIMIDLAKQKPKTTASLKRMRGLDASVVQRKGDELLALIKKSTERDQSEWPRAIKRDNKRVDDALVETLSAVVRLCAQKNDISAKMITTRNDLERASRGESAGNRLFQGWRHSIAGKNIEDFLAGKKRLHVDEGTLTLS